MKRSQLKRKPMRVGALVRHREESGVNATAGLLLEIFEAHGARQALVEWDSIGTFTYPLSCLARHPLSK